MIPATNLWRCADQVDGYDRLQGVSMRHGPMSIRNATDRNVGLKRGGIKCLENGH
jgi:hypothetical protein